MSHFTLVERRLDSISRQAKRLHQATDLPLRHAQAVLATALYRCASWHDLQGRIRSERPGEHVQLLVDLPRSPQALEYFWKVRRSLVDSLTQHIRTSRDLAGIHDLVHTVFGVDAPPTSLKDLVPALPASAWRPSGMGTDPWAIVESEVDLNGMRLHLVGTRTYLPAHYDLGPGREGQYAEPVGEKLQIVWAEPDAWRQAALDYLDDPEAEDVVLPRTQMTADMASHKAWFESALSAMRHVDEYGIGDDDLVPTKLRGDDCYVVFGYPAVGRSHTLSARGELELASDNDNFSRVVSLHGSYVCVEWVAYDPDGDRHPGEFPEYFEKLRDRLLGQGRLPACRRQDGAPGVLFVRPATDFDLRQALKVEYTYFDDEVAFVLSTDSLELTRDLLDKVTARDLFLHGPAESPIYVAKFFYDALPPEEHPRLDLDTTSRGLTTMSAMVHSSRIREREGQCEILATVSPSLIALVDRLGRKAVDAAMSFGLVERRPTSFLRYLEASRSERLDFPRVSQDEAEWLDRPLLGLFWPLSEDEGEE